MTSFPTIAYADCFSGLSGDMFLGALLHCGLPEKTLRQDLAALKLRGYNLDIAETQKQGIACIKLNVQDEGRQRFRHLGDLKAIALNSGLEEHIVSNSVAVFEEIARAEAKVHGIDIHQVHFHEVGAVDTIVDVIGSIAGLHRLGISKLYSAPVPHPKGFIRCAHGMLPLPAPAVCEILKGVPCYGAEQNKELVTPTGAALLKVLAADFGAMPPMTVISTGYGAGSHQLAGDQPNLFRLIMGTARQMEEHQEIEVIETHIDDWSPESFPYLCDLLFQAGALDVSLTPIQMKKGRPGFQIKIIAPPHLSNGLRAILFEETTTIGLRFHRERRQTLPRAMVEVTTPWGTLQAKKVEMPSGFRVYPEYAECRRVAEKFNIPLQLVYDAVKEAAGRQ